MPDREQRVFPVVANCGDFTESREAAIFSHRRHPRKILNGLLLVQKQFTPTFLYWLIHWLSLLPGPSLLRRPGPIVRLRSRYFCASTSSVLSGRSNGSRILCIIGPDRNLSARWQSTPTKPRI